MIKIKEILDEKDWHPALIIRDFPFQQSFWYGEMQRARGRQVKRLIFSKDGDDIAYGQFIVYPLFGKLQYWYAAYGPIVNGINQEDLRDMKESMSDFLKSFRPVFARFDFSPALPPELSIQAGSIFKAASKSSSFGSYFQPRHEWYIDISKSADEMLQAMTKNTRYYVKFAEKNGVKIEVIESGRLVSHLPQFLSLMKDTAQRNKFSLHDDEYYKCFFEEVTKRGKGFLVESKLGEQILSTHFIVIEGAVAHYVFGASSDERKELCATYLAHFTSMLEAKKHGALWLNSGGISVGDEAPQWKGVTAFKKKFGGEIVGHGAYFDIVVRPIWYNLYNIRKWLKRFI